MDYVATAKVLLIPLPLLCVIAAGYIARWRDERRVPRREKRSK